MDIKAKLVITLLVLWFILHLAAHPETKFSEWGKRVFGSYPAFIITILAVCFLPIVIIGIVWLWSL